MPENFLRVMSFNLRYGSPNPPHEWPARLPVAARVFEEQRPDVVGTQEGWYAQLTDLSERLPDYRWIGLGREGGSRSEHMAVFYRPERLAPLEFDHFWLSDTPNVIGSSTWGNQNRRMVTWVRFRDKVTEEQFYFFNTHLDFTEDIHVKSVGLIQQRMAELAHDLPIILVGDFNAAAEESRPWALLVNDGPTGFTDTWLAAPEHRSGDISTFHGYETPGSEGPRIDWILSRGFRPLAAEIVTTVAETGQYPSDHFPIVADLAMEAASADTH